jgi:hypothetical protein
MELLKQVWIVLESSITEANFNKLINHVIQIDVLAFKKHFFRLRYIATSVLQGKKNHQPDSGFKMTDMEEEMRTLDKELHERESKLAKKVTVSVFKWLIEVMDESLASEGGYRKFVIDLKEKVKDSNNTITKEEFVKFV